MTAEQHQSSGDVPSDILTKDIESNESSISAKHDSISDLSQQHDASPIEQKSPEEKSGGPPEIEYPPFKVVLVLMACMFLVAFLFALDRLIIATVSTLPRSGRLHDTPPRGA